MKIAVIDDYQDAFRKLECFPKLKGHDVIVYCDTEKDPAKLAARLKDADAVLLTQQRSPFPRAVVEALKKGRPGFAAVDVYEDEPVLGASHPLIKMDNVVCTPHLGYVEQRTYESYFGNAIEQILAFAGGKPINVLNPEALKKP